MKKRLQKQINQGSQVTVKEFKKSKENKRKGKKENQEEIDMKESKYAFYSNSKLKSFSNPYSIRPDIVNLHQM